MIICKCISHKCVKKATVVQHSCIMWQRGAAAYSSRFKCLENTLLRVFTKVIRNLSLWPIFGVVLNIFLLDISRSGKKINAEVSVKYLTVFSRINTCGTSGQIDPPRRFRVKMPILFSIIHRNPNYSMLCKSSIALRII